LKIINAFWELRNLGVSSSEITIELSDTIDDLKAILFSFKGPEYIVFKVPSGGVEFLKCLTDNGFYFVETLSEMQLDITDYNIPEKLARFDKNLTYKILPSEDLDSLGYEIKKGIFNTDRIAMDSNFGKDIAANRYFNWIKDEVLKGNNIYEILYKEEPIGFFGLKQIGDRSFDNFLAGLYIEKSNFGFGFSTITKSIEEIKIRNGKYLITHVSSNNISIYRLYIQLGFMVNNHSYCMTKLFH